MFQLVGLACCKRLCGLLLSGIHLTDSICVTRSILISNTWLLHVRRHYFK